MSRTHLPIQGETLDVELLPFSDKGLKSISGVSSVKHQQSMVIKVVLKKDRPFEKAEDPFELEIVT